MISWRFVAQHPGDSPVLPVLASKGLTRALEPPVAAPQVYEAVFLMATRQFKRAAELLLDAIATFTRQGLGKQCLRWGQGCL